MINREYYVVNSNPGGTGTAANPFDGLASVPLSVFAPGSTLVVRGVCDGPFTVPRGGSGRARFTLTGEFGAIDLGGGQEQSVNVSSVSYVDITNLAIRGFRSDVATYAPALNLRGSSYVLVKDVLLEDNDGSGTDCGSKASAVLYVDVQARRNGAMGFHAAKGVSGLYYLRCKADTNGLKQGAHNFSVNPTRNALDTGWVADGDVFSHANAWEPRRMLYKEPDVPFTLARTVGDQMAPQIYEYGWQDGIVYVNLGGAQPTAASLLISADDIQDVLYEDCESFRAHHYLDYPHDEGHGYAADDGAGNVTYRNSLAAECQGNAWSLNMSHNCAIENCEARDHVLVKDVKDGIRVFSAENISIRGTTAVGYTRNGISFQKNMNDQDMADNYLANNQGYGAALSSGFAQTQENCRFEANVLGDTYNIS